jgi:Uma2 family endonuclease
VSTFALQPDLHRHTLKEYHRLIECGGFDEHTRVELLDGFIVDMSPRKPQHENAVGWLVDWVVGHLDRARYRHLFSAPLTIGQSEPEPDIAIIERSAPQLAHPGRALLVIEVALSSRHYDLGVKPSVYAAAVEEYWVVDLERRGVIVHRDPASDSYRSIALIADGDALEANAVDIGTLPTGELFAAAFAEQQA